MSDRRPTVHEQRQLRDSNARLASRVVALERREVSLEASLNAERRERWRLEEQLAIEEQERADFEASQARLLEQLKAAQAALRIALDYQDVISGPDIDRIAAALGSNPASEPKEA